MLERTCKHEKHKPVTISDRDIYGNLCDPKGNLLSR